MSGASHAQIFLLAEEADLRLADDARFFHLLAQFGRFHEFLHPCVGVPTAADREIVGVLRAAQDMKTLFSRSLAPLLGGVDGAFELGVIGDFVTDDDVWHMISFFWLNC